MRSSAKAGKPEMDMKVKKAAVKKSSAAREYASACMRACVCGRRQAGGAHAHEKGLRKW